MGTLRTLARELRAKARDIDRIGSEAKRGAALAIIDDLIDHTPVDEGETVSSWEVGIGSPPVARRAPFAPGRKGSTAAANREAARSAAHAVLAAPVAPGVPIWISNASDAIVLLNGGSSTQEPAGFVERAIIVGRQFVAKFKVSARG